MEAVWDRLPRGVRTAIMRLRLRTGIDTAKLGLGPTAGDLGTRRSFQVPSSGGHGAVRVNLVGREPRGRIDPTAYDAYCAELTAQLLELVNADTGRPAVLRVIKISEHYRGERLHDLPDLLVQWNQDAPIDAVTSPRVGVVRGGDPHVRSGDHRPSGLLLFRGPNVQESATAGAVPIESLAPTIAALCGVRLPDVDSEPIPEVAGVTAVSASADR
jgi:predicted AlkP superfamily phosphohydrolase/phosphomutase